MDGGMKMVKKIVIKARKRNFVGGKELTYFILNNRPIKDCDIEPSTQNADTRGNSVVFPIRFYSGNIVNILDEYDLLDDFFRKFTKEEYYIRNLQEHPNYRQNGVYQFYLNEEHYTAEQLWHTIVALISNDGDFEKFYKHFLDDERFIEMVNTHSNPYFLKSVDKFFPQFSEKVRERFTKEEELREASDHWVALDWLKKYPEDRELFLSENNITRYNAIELATMFYENRHDYIDRVYDDQWRVFEWVKKFPEDKELLQKNFAKDIDLIVNWVKEFPEDKKEMIKLVDEKDIARWCRDIEKNGKSLYLFKKYKLIDTELYEKADDLGKKFMMDINYSDTGFKTQIANRWRFFIFHINIISNAEFQERLPIIKQFVARNSANRYMGDVIHELYKQGLMIENKKQAKAVAKLFLKALEKGNQRTVKSMIDRVIWSEDYENYNIFGFDVFKDIDKLPNVKRIMMNKKLSAK
jgi:hypothetical protein